MPLRQPIDWEAVKRERSELLLLQIDNDESGVMRILKNIIKTKGGFEALGIQEGIVEFEFPHIVGVQ